MVPDGWILKSMRSVLERVAKPVTPEPAKLYREIGIRSHGKGIFHKEPVSGERLGDKRVFEVVPDCLVFNIIFAWEQAVARTTQAEAGMIASHRFPMYRPKDDLCDVDYLTFFFKSKRGKNLLELASPGGAGRNKTLGQNEFSKLAFFMPSVDQQKQIAKILSTWDMAIDVLERAIKNSLSRKKSLMQRLVTGRSRLPGFAAKWRRVSVRNMGRTVSGGTPDTTRADFWSGDIPWVTPSDLTGLGARFIESTERTITRAGLAASAATVLPAHSILICTRASVGELAISKVEMATNQGFKSLVPSSEFSVDFLYYLFQQGKNVLIRMSCGSTFLELSKKDLEKLAFLVPDLPEQRSIAGVLNVADREVHALVELKRKLGRERHALICKLTVPSVARGLVPHRN